MVLGKSSQPEGLTLDWPLLPACSVFDVPGLHVIGVDVGDDMIVCEPLRSRGGRRRPPFVGCAQRTTSRPIGTRIQNRLPRRSRARQPGIHGCSHRSTNGTQRAGHLTLMSLSFGAGSAFDDVAVFLKSTQLPGWVVLEEGDHVDRLPDDWIHLDRPLSDGMKDWIKRLSTQPINPDMSIEAEVEKRLAQARREAQVQAAMQARIQAEEKDECATLVTIFLLKVRFLGYTYPGTVRVKGVRGYNHGWIVDGGTTTTMVAGTERRTYYNYLLCTDGFMYSVKCVGENVYRVECWVGTPGGARVLSWLRNATSRLRGTTTYGRAELAHPGDPRPQELEELLRVVAAVKKLEAAGKLRDMIA